MDELYLFFVWRGAYFSWTPADVKKKHADIVEKFHRTANSITPLKVALTTSDE